MRAREMEVADPADDADEASLPVVRQALPSVGRPRAVPLLGPLLFRLYAFDVAWLRRRIRSLLLRFEGGPAFTLTLRAIFEKYHGVEVGLFTHGAWYVPEHLAAGTRVGRYCSISVTSVTFTRNHPMDWRSSSGLFFNPDFGFASEDLVPRTRLEIGNDVWIGHNAIVLPSVTSIGDGAVIGAGAVVHKNVPPYAVVTGHPSRVVRYRFSEQTIRELQASRWWERSFEELAARPEEFLGPIEQRLAGDQTGEIV